MAPEVGSRISCHSPSNDDDDDDGAGTEEGDADDDDENDDGVSKSAGLSHELALVVALK